MMQLAYDLTDTVEIGGIDHDIDLSFDNVLRILDLISDKEINGEVMVTVSLELFFGVCFLIDVEKQAAILKQVLSDVVGVSDNEEENLDVEGNPMPKNSPDEGKVYDLKQDANYIYASFMQDYQIDLIEQQGKLHWHKFNALLAGLKDDTKFRNVIEIRQSELPSGKGSGKQREQMKKMKKLYKLKDES